MWAINDHYRLSRTKVYWPEREEFVSLRHYVPADEGSMNLSSTWDPVRHLIPLLNVKEYSSLFELPVCRFFGLETLRVSAVIVFGEYKCLLLLFFNATGK